MKSILKPLIAFFIIISISTTSKADSSPDFVILNPQFTFLFISKSFLVKIDSGYEIKTILRDSIVTDSLLIYVNLPKILIKSLSFSRHDTAYCFANKFPASDSLKWRLPYRGPGNTDDTIKLRDSILELEPAYEHNNTIVVIWHLKKKYTFNIGDTFSLVLAEIPDRPPPSNILPQNEYTLKSGNSRESRIFVYLEGYPNGSMEEQPHFPLFDVSGKKMLFTLRKSSIFILPHGEK